MQVLCGLQGIFLLFNCQTPESGVKIPLHHLTFPCSFDTITTDRNYHSEAKVFPEAKIDLIENSRISLGILRAF